MGTKEMLKVVRADGGEWAGRWEEARCGLITQLERVADMFTKDTVGEPDRVG
jgi:hypothetical protein